MKEETVGAEDENRKQAEEDANEDLELRDEDAGKVTGGFAATGTHIKDGTIVVRP